MLAVADEPAREWCLGEQIFVTLPDGQVVRCRVVNVLDDGTELVTQTGHEDPRRTPAEGR